MRCLNPVLHGKKATPAHLRLVVGVVLQDTHMDERSEGTAAFASFLNLPCSWACDERRPSLTRVKSKTVNRQDSNNGGKSEVVGSLCAQKAHGAHLESHGNVSFKCISGAIETA